MLTTKQLKKKGHSLASRCPPCKKAEEDLEHLLIHCPIVWGMWAALLFFLGAGQVCPFSVKDVILGWKSFPIRKKDRKLWLTAPICLLRLIWKERNIIVFQNAIFSLTS